MSQKKQPHDFYKDGSGYPNEWRYMSGLHNGPQCKRCGQSWCHHCEPGRYEEDCPVEEPFDKLSITVSS